MPSSGEGTVLRHSEADPCCHPQPCDGGAAERGLLSPMRHAQHALERGMMEFAGFRLDPKDERLWKTGREVALRRKPFAILRYLVANPGRLITHAELLE